MITTMNFTKIIPVVEIKRAIKEIPKEGGVYKQYVDKEGLDYLDGVYPTTKEIASDGTEVYLLYIGRAKNLFDRLKWHLGITNTSHSSISHGFVSTLRVSYMANHKDIACLSEQDKLDEFLNHHIYIQYMATEDFVAVEEQLIKESDLPLNIKDNIHPFVKINQNRRKEIKAKYLSENIEETDALTKTVTDYPVKTKYHNRSNGMIDDSVLRKYARKAGKEGIKNKSNFVRWFRDIEQQSAAQSRLHKAWDERSSDA